MQALPEEVLKYFKDESKLEKFMSDHDQFYGCDTATDDALEKLWYALPVRKSFKLNSFAAVNGLDIKVAQEILALLLDKAVLTVRRDRGNDNVYVKTRHTLPIPLRSIQDIGNSVAPRKVVLITRNEVVDLTIAIEGDAIRLSFYDNTKGHKVEKFFRQKGDRVEQLNVLERKAGLSNFDKKSLLKEIKTLIEG